MDAPLRAHWPKLGLWGLLEAILIALSVVVKADPGGTFTWDPTITDCRDQAWNCQFSRARAAQHRACRGSQQGWRQEVLRACRA